LPWQKANVLEFEGLSLWPCSSHLSIITGDMVSARDVGFVRQEKIEQATYSQGALPRARFKSKGP
jgi:hypothetical protein